MNKILLINKPKDWTSFDVVAKIRSIIRTKYQVAGSKQKIKVGHAGTLDPFATGLLILLIGDATKDQDKFMKLDKKYEATLKLGFTSTTGDPEGEIAPFYSSSEAQQNREVVSSRQPRTITKITRKDIGKLLKQFIGEIEQTPPIYSAIKIDGKRAYKLAREGKNVELKPRKISIYSIKILEYSYPLLKLEIHCSSGTYIRTLAEDIGIELQTGAYLTNLKRTQIGDYALNNAIEIDEVLSQI